MGEDFRDYGLYPDEDDDWDNEEELGGIWDEYDDWGYDPQEEYFAWREEHRIAALVEDIGGWLRCVYERVLEKLGLEVPF